MYITHFHFFYTFKGSLLWKFGKQTQESVFSAFFPEFFASNMLANILAERNTEQFYFHYNLCKDFFNYYSSNPKTLFKVAIMIWTKLLCQ